MEIWIPITIVAAFLQNLRSALQKSLTDQLSTGGASYCRFVYALPFALLYYAGLGLFEPLPAINAVFLGWAMLGGLAQIAGTFALIAAFSHRNFAVSTAWSKTETVQTVLFGIVILGEAISVQSSIGILISLVGVLLLSFRGASVAGMLPALMGPAARWGVLSGAGFAVAAVSYRGASLSLADGDFVVRSATTLVWVLGFQSLVMGLYLAIRESGELMRVARVARTAVWVGVAGMLASAGWFAAMTLQNAAYVRAVGQVELLFTFLLSVFWFRERSTRMEVVAILLLTSGILLLLL